MSKCPIMKRMKVNYENRYETFLTRRTPVIIRLDGKAFHTYTKGLEKPFDIDLTYSLAETAIYLCENISGAKCAYTFSDEISILVTDYDNLGTQAWFDYSLNKVLSVSASYATFKFNQLMFELVKQPAIFDSRAFNIPEHDCNNYFVARQKDCVKNSIGQCVNSKFSAKQLHGKSNEQRLDMLFESGFDWHELASNYKYGTFIKRVERVENGFTRRPFDIVETPLFKDEPNVILDMVAYENIKSTKSS